MFIVPAILGTAILVLTAVDLLLTAFVEGVGPLSLWMGLLLARGLRFMVLRWKMRRILAWGGVLSILLPLVSWTILLWLGWTLIFCSAPAAVKAAVTGAPADVWQRIYFTGYNLFTLGMGDFIPHGALFEILTDLCCASGFLLFGAAIAYLVPVISTATYKRQIGSYIWVLGASPTEIVIRAWNGTDCAAIQPHLLALTPMLLALSESHFTYPVLHFFRSARRSAATGVNIAMLDEALTVMEHGLVKDHRPDTSSLAPIRAALNEYILTLRPILSLAPEDGVPPVPSLKALRAAGLPVVDDVTFAQALSGQAEHRTLLRKLARVEGWTWNSVWPGDMD
jgi:hypothetical protein